MSKTDRLEASDPVLRAIAHELLTTVNHTRTCADAQTQQQDETESVQEYEFRLNSFLTLPRTCTKLFPPRVQKQRYRRITVQERLILVSVGSKSKEQQLDEDEAGKEENDKVEHTKGGDGAVLVAGLEVLEYTLFPLDHNSTNDENTETQQQRQPAESIVYIAKVDTSGCWPLPGLDTRGVSSPVRALVHGYLRAMRSSELKTISSSSIGSTTTTQMSALTLSSTSQSSGDRATGDHSTSGHHTPYKKSLYVFARAQPQYLFAESAKNTGKHILNDRGLVRWWKNMIDSVYTLNINSNDSWPDQKRRDPTKVQGWWLIPGIETERQATNIIQSTSSTYSITTASSSSSSSPLSSPFQWTYGYPDKGSKEMAHTLIPQFPDDPKSRMMQSPSCAGGFVNIDTFWELAAIGEESGAGKITGFFRVIEEGEQPGPEREKEQKEGLTAKMTTTSTSDSVPVAGTTDDYTKVINFLLGLDFSTLESAQESTRLWNRRVHIWAKRATEKEQEIVKERESEKQEQQKQQSEKEEKVAVTAKDQLSYSAPQPTSAWPSWIQRGHAQVRLRHAEEIPACPAQQGNITSTTATTTTPAVHTLTPGCIKRKTLDAAPVINVLNANLIKRKEAPSATAASVVNVLSASMIKRKVTAASTTGTTVSTTAAPADVSLDASPTAATASSSAPAVNVLGANCIKRRKVDP
ncbi:hypothetical protein BGZ54_010188 [Gamsiella multidivaricata]|nr:hypothetical protein BGZ54_010188 [Gamsiella multidivaricata]